MKKQLLCIALTLCCLFLANAFANEQEERSLCSNDCSGHGTCILATCTCDAGWTGTDCSQPLIGLATGVPADGTVETYKWVYYFIAVPTSGKALLLNITQSQTGDIDVYVKAGSTPSRSNYDYRDISTKKVVVIEIDPAQTATYWIGLYGFATASYTIVANINDGCPNGCSGHGSCSSGVCTCNQNWVGADCSTSVVALTFGQTVSGSVQGGQMAYYQINLPSSASTMVYTLDHTGGTGDCDLYVRSVQLPTLWLWDYANVTTNEISTITIEEPATGDWYTAVYGFNACNYTLKVEKDDSVNCANLCTNRGTCGGSICQCDSAFSGNYCERMNAPLSEGVSVNGYVENNLWNYYVYNSNTDNNVVISITQSATGDCDLYVRSGMDPTRFYYDYQDISLARSYNLTIEDPGATSWHIGVYGWAQCTYSIAVYETAACPNGCSGNGVCTSSGTCICNAGWNGQACDSNLVTLTSDGTLVGGQFVGYNNWTYFTVSMNNAASMHLLVKETSTVGFVWVYVAKDTPTLRNYLFSSTQLDSGVHRIDIDTQTQTSDTYIVGVYGNPYSQQQGVVSFSLVAWAPQF